MHRDHRAGGHPWLAGAVLAISLGLVGLGGCGGMPNTQPPSTSASAAIPPETPDVTATPARPSATTVPDKKAEAAWRKIESAGAPEDWLSRAEVPLPAPYWPDRGVDGDDEPNAEKIQRQLAVYLLRLRAAHQKQADQLGADLWTVPAAWCSVVLPTRTPKEFDRQISQSERVGRRMARLLDGKFSPPASTATLRFLEYARADAGRQFCPKQAAIPGRLVSGGVSPVAQIPERTPVLDSAVPAYYYEGPSYNLPYQLFARDFVALAYVEILAQRQGKPVSSVPVVLECDVVKHLLEDGDGVAETAKNTLHLFTIARRSAREKARKKERVAGEAARDAFALLEQRRNC